MYGWLIRLAAVPLVAVLVRKLVEKPYNAGARYGTSFQFNGLKHVYWASDDSHGELLHTSLTLLRAGFAEVDDLISVVGSLSALHLLVTIRPKRITFFDMNPVAVTWGKTVVELILMSSSPQEYIARLFARDVVSFEQRKGSRLTYANMDEFMDLPVNESWWLDTGERLSESGRQLFEGPVRRLSRMMYKGVRTWAPCEDKGRFFFYTRSRLGGQPFSGYNPVSFRYGEGFLSSQWTFDRVKSVLREVPLDWVEGVDFPLADPGDLLPQASGRRALVFVMDMFSSGFAAPWGLQRVAAWQRHAGQDGFIMVQTHTPMRDALVREFIPGPRGGSWQSRSLWNSSRLLPEYVCLHKGRLHRCDCSAPALEGPAAAAWLWEVAACNNTAGHRSASALCSAAAAEVYTELLGTYASIPLPPEARNASCGAATPVRLLDATLSDAMSYDCCV